MISLLLSVFFSVLLLVHFRFFPKYKISTFQTIALNYLSCFVTGLLLMPSNQNFSIEFDQNWTWYFLLLGFGFFITFIFSGVSTQKIGMTLTSLANNVSLVIPVLFSLFVFGNKNKTFDVLNYIGLILAVLAVGLSTFKADDSNKNNFWTKGGLALTVFLMYGISNTALNFLNLKYITEPTQVIPRTLVMIVGAIVCGVSLLVFKLIKGTEKIEIKNIVASISLGVCNFLSFYYLLKALSEFDNSGAFVYPIYNIGVILLAALISITLFKEKILKLNLIGLIIAIIAILLISYQEIFN